MIKRILITGGEGFIGSHLVKALEDSGKYERVVSFDIKSFQNINHYSDLDDTCKNVKPQIIVHLAAFSNNKECEEHPEAALQTNIVGTFNVLKVAKKYKAKVIMASSAAVPAWVFDEAYTLYGFSKFAMEELAELFDNVFIARFYNVYGPGSNSVVNKFINNIKKGKSVTLYGNTTRDYVYIKDVIDFLTEQIDDFIPGLYEVGTAKGTKLLKLVRMIEKILNKKAMIIQGPKKDEVQESIMEKTAMYKTKFSLEKGIKELI